MEKNRCFFNTANYEATIGSISGTDGWITINTDHSWDYTPPSISGYCFQSVLAHEVGHALGFVSKADDGVNDMDSLDIYRFQRTDGSGDYNPDTIGEFQTTPRLVDYNTPNDDHNSNIFEPGETGPIDVEYRMADGSPDQASHFRQGISPQALMEPALGWGDTLYPDFIRVPDLKMFDAIFSAFTLGSFFFKEYSTILFEVFSSMVMSLNELIVFCFNSSKDRSLALSSSPKALTSSIIFLILGS